MPEDSIEIILKVDDKQLDDIKILPTTILTNNKEVSLNDCARIVSVFEELKKLIMYKATSLVNATVDKMMKF